MPTKRKPKPYLVTWYSSGVKHERRFSLASDASTWVRKLEKRKNTSRVNMKRRPE